MASEVDICNRALQKLGAKRIVDLLDDSVNARACNVAYSPVINALLRAHAWNFAIKRATLAAIVPIPEWGRSNSFTLPSDFIALTDDYPEYNCAEKDWVIEGRYILTDDSSPLHIRYISMITDTADMDALFIEAAATKIALEICEEITQSNTKKSDLKDDYKAAIAEARRRNAFEKRPSFSADDSWLYSRR